MSTATGLISSPRDCRPTKRSSTSRRSSRLINPRAVSPTAAMNTHIYTHKNPNKNFSRRNTTALQTILLTPFATDKTHLQPPQLTHVTLNFTGVVNNNTNYLIYTALLLSTSSIDLIQLWDRKFGITNSGATKNSKEIRLLRLGVLVNHFLP